MEQKSTYLDLTIISAADLKRKWLSGDQTAAVAWVDPSAKKTTSIVSSDGSNVQWHEKLILSLNGVDNLSRGKLLTIEIHARGTWGDSLLGSVYVPLIELAMDGEKRGNTILMYQIVQPSGKRQGSVKFSAKVVQPRVSASISPWSASGAPQPSAPPILPLEDDCNVSGSNAFYPPPSAICTVETNDERLASEANSPYPYPPQLHLSQNYTAGNDSWQHDRLPDPPYGMGSYPPHVYPPVNTNYPLHTSCVSCSPHSNYTGEIPYPRPSPLALETPYPPLTSVYPPPTLFSEAPYPPIASRIQFPPTVPPHPSEMYLSASFYPYLNLSRPSNPPSYAQQPATVHYP